MWKYPQSYASNVEISTDTYLYPMRCGNTTDRKKENLLNVRGEYHTRHGNKIEDDYPCLRGAQIMGVSNNSIRVGPSEEKKKHALLINSVQ